MQHWVIQRTRDLILYPPNVPMVTSHSLSLVWCGLFLVGVNRSIELTAMEWSGAHALRFICLIRSVVTLQLAR